MNWRCASTVSCVVLTSNYGHDSNWWFHYLLKVIHAVIISKVDNGFDWRNFIKQFGLFSADFRSDTSKLTPLNLNIFSALPGRECLKKP